MTLAKELNDIVEQIVSNYKPDRIILFGSFMRKKTIANDIDLLIIKDTKTPRLHRRSEALRNVSYNIPLDLLILTNGELDYLISKKSLFINDILSKGKLLYG